MTQRGKLWRRHRHKFRLSKEELDAWMEKHDLTHDTFWRTPEEEYGEEYSVVDPKNWTVE